MKLKYVLKKKKHLSSKSLVTSTRKRFFMCVKSRKEKQCNTFDASLQTT